MIPTEFHGEPENPFTELSQLRIRLESDRFGSKYALHASLKIDEMSYDHNGTDYVIGVSAAYLNLSLNGLRTVEGTYLGEQRLDDAMESKSGVKTSKDTSAADAGLKASTSAAPEASGQFSFGSSSESRNQTSKNQSRKMLAVRSLPGDRWSISVPRVTDQKEWIHGSPFIDHEICELVGTTVNSARSVDAQLMIRKIDIEVKARRGNKVIKSLRVFRNQEAILTQLAAKALKRHSAVNNLAADDKVIVVSRHTLEQSQ